MITLSLASGTGIKGGTLTLVLSIASTGGDQCIGVQWSFGFTSDLTLASVTLGAASIAAAKSLNRIGPLCVVAAVGTNDNVIGDGALVTATFNIAASPSTSSIPITITGVVAADVNGNPLTTSGLPGVITIDTPSLACPLSSGPITQGVFYSGTMIASGGVAPYTYASLGILPPGINLNASTGVLSGIATTAGIWGYTIQVTDSLGATATASCSLTVNPTPPPPPPLSLACPLSSATLTVPYLQALMASGGTPGYTYSISSGSLPPGLTLDPATGIVSGTPTLNGIYPYTGTVVDSLGVTKNTTCSITVTGSAPPPILVVACPVVGATFGIAYAGVVSISGGTSPYTSTILSGMLPPGLTLDPSTGIISGIPEATGTFTYTAQVTDSLGRTADVTCQIIVVGPTPPPVSPTGSCRTQLILWQHSQSPQVEITQDRNDDWTDCGNPGLKFFQGFKLDADTFGSNKNIQIRDADAGALHAPQPSPINHQGRQTMPYSFATPFLAHSVRRESLDLVPWRKFGISYIWEPSPEFTYTWKTQRTSHGLSGFHNLQRMLFAYASNATVTLSVVAFDGTSPATVTLPSTAGVYKKVVVVFSFNKGLLFEYSATSASPFQIWKNDLEVVLGMWGRQGPCVNYPLVGGARGDEASI